MNSPTKTAVLHPLLGQTLGQYRVEEVLGQGGMGVVYRAYDLKLQRAVALKFLPADLTSDAERRKRFQLEARAAARISHPAIAQVYDVLEHDGNIFIAMELIEGKTVRELIVQRELDLLGALDIALQVAAGLAKAHGMGIVHRDIKPANLIQAPDGHVKILDFGLAKLLDPDTATASGPAAAHELSTVTQTQCGTVKGTPAYMSPEQVKGREIDARCDLFSLGVVLFEMAAGEVPFRRATPMETMHAVAFEETPTLSLVRPNLPAGLQRIVAKCLKKLPEERYPDARALIADLRELRRETEAGRARPVSLKERWSDARERFTQLRPADRAWLAGGVLAVAGLIYLLTARAGLLFPLLPFAFIGLLIFRNIRNQPRRMLELFVRKTAKLPEVRLILCEAQKLTVGVDRPVAQLYGRINQQLNYCNRKLFFGPPLSVVIRADLSAEEIHQLLASGGVQYVRDDAIPGR